MKEMNTQETIDSETGAIELSDSDALKASISQTKASLAEKLDSLKTEVEHVVDTAVTSAKGTVQEVRRELDIRTHIRNNPWVFIATATALGAFLGSKLTSSKKVEPTEPEPYQPGSYATHKVPEGKSSTLWENVKGEISAEGMKLTKSLASNAITAAKDILKESVPPVAGPSIDRIYEKVLRQLA